MAARRHSVTRPKTERSSVVEKDAANVRTIFEQYLMLGSLDRLMVGLRERGIVSKVPAAQIRQHHGRDTIHPRPPRLPAAHRFYVGEVVYKGEVLRGAQAPIIDRKLFEAVQSRLAEQRSNHVEKRSRSEALLTGLIFVRPRQRDDSDPFPKERCAVSPITCRRPCCMDSRPRQALWIGYQPSKSRTSWAAAIVQHFRDGSSLELQQMSSSGTCSASKSVRRSSGSN